MNRDLAVSVAAAPRMEVDSTFERHVTGKWVARALVGSSSGGRWAAAKAFPVIYLGRPTASVIAEAYRHLVDDIEGMTADRVRGRRLIRAEVRSREILDLRSRRSWMSVGLTEADLFSDVGDYDACQMIGHVAHQLGLHGILAPSATGLGETLRSSPICSLPPSCQLRSVTRWSGPGSPQIHGGSV